jgi:hypothetical protein
MSAGRPSVVVAEPLAVTAKSREHVRRPVRFRGMGLLDDAIREHLDLKRRRGADPAEIERAERDALGPVRRGPEGDPPSDFDEFREPLRADAWATTAVPDDEDPFAEEPPYDDLAAPSDSYALADERRAAESEPEGSSDASARSPRSRAADAPQRGVLPRHLADQPVGDETVEWDVERALNEPSPEEHDDVLEGTPEFLQDAPEHDRLWFEQRPPRDFDFNG